MKEISDVELAWVAGWLEGEGTFLYKGDKSNIVGVSTDLDVLQKIQNILGGSICSIKKRKEHWKDAWVWKISKVSDVIQIIPKLLPHLGKRRTIAAQLTLEKAMLKYNEMNLKSKQLKEKRLMMKELFEKGYTHQKIADILKMERSSVSHALKKFKPS